MWVSCTDAVGESDKITGRRVANFTDFYAIYISLPIFFISSYLEKKILEPNTYILPFYNLNGYNML